MFTQDAIDELDQDLLMPSGDYLSFQDLGINSQKVGIWLAANWLCVESVCG